MSRRARTALLAAALAVIGAGPARAGNPVSAFDTPSADQYVESLPGGGGPSAPGLNGRQGRGRSLPPAVRRRLAREGGPLAGPLAALASDRRFGAPGARSGAGAGAGGSSKAGGRGETLSATPVGEGSGRSPFKALSDAASSAGEGTNLVWILVGLLLVASGLGVIALSRRTQSGTPGT